MIELTLDMFLQNNDEPKIYQIEETLCMPWSLDTFMKLKFEQKNLNLSGEDDYGTLNNPIIANGVPGSLAILNRLLTKDGSRLKYVRNGSTHSQVLETQVDEYTVKSVDGKLEMKLYIDMYNFFRSTASPAGLTLKPYDKLTDNEIYFLKEDVWNSTPE